MTDSEDGVRRWRTSGADPVASLCDVELRLALDDVPRQALELRGQQPSVRQRRAPLLHQRLRPRHRSVDAEERRIRDLLRARRRVPAVLPSWSVVAVTSRTSSAIWKASPMARAVPRERVPRARRTRARPAPPSRDRRRDQRARLAADGSARGRPVRAGAPRPRDRAAGRRSSRAARRRHQFAHDRAAARWLEPRHAPARSSGARGQRHHRQPGRRRHRHAVHAMCIVGRPRRMSSSSMHGRSSCTSE